MFQGLPMTIFEKELQTLKPYDPVQFTGKDKKTGLDFITTAGHGYLVVPRDGSHQAVTAFRICKYGFKGKHAVYLEEDCEYGEFVKSL